MVTVYSPADIVAAIAAHPNNRVSAEFIFSGLSDYWGGDGDRWSDNKACAFAFYNHETTLADLIDEWTDDYADRDGKEAWETVSHDEIRAALFEMLTDQGRAEINDVCEMARSVGHEAGHQYPDEGAWDTDCTCELCTNADDCSDLTAIVMLTVETEEGEYEEVGED